MKKNTKTILRNTVYGLALGLGIGITIPKWTSLFQEYGTEIEQIITNENENIIANLMQETNAEVSKTATNIINEISSVNVDNEGMNALQITKSQLADTYKLYDDEEKKHKYQSLYDEKTDSIKWDEAVDKIYENSQKEVANDPNNELELEAFSKEEIEKLVEEMKTAYEHIKQDFKDYDTKELACKLEYYTLNKSNIDNGDSIAITTPDEIIYFPVYDELRQITQTDTTYHESFHLCQNNCIDNQNNDYLSSFIPTFIEENYAALYAQDITQFYQTSYINYNDALNLVQLALSLSDSYQIDELLKYTICNDPVNFLKEFPVYGEDKEKFLLDTIEALRGLNILVNSKQTENFYNEENPYTKKTIQEVEKGTYDQISKIFYNNLIVLNEQHPEMTLEDNCFFITLYENIKNSIPIDTQYILSIDNDYDTSYDIDGRLSEVDTYFTKYIADKYSISEEEATYDLFYSTPTENYTLPDFIPQEKKEFYHYIGTENENQVFKEARPLIKQK